LQASLAFRLPSVVYRRLLALAPHPRLPEKADCGWPLLSMAGRGHLTMLQEMLRSLGRAWSRLPALVLVTDGSIEPGELGRELAWWPKPVTVRTPADYRSAAEAAGRPEIAEFSRRHVLGIKFAAMMHEAARGPVFWCDTDILFFQDLLDRSREMDTHSKPIYAAEDWLRGYDETLAGKVGRELERPPWVNSGLVWMTGDIYADAGLAPHLRDALGHCNHFTEQTLIALATVRRGSVLWSRQMILLGDDDQFELRMRRIDPSFIARHYLTPHRHLFWRDALALRLKNLP
jgi:hypothetical protein